ncbi:epimerase family protein SDR39U1 [Varanus komodoensis]|uniref:Short chain dehydrogenase/reductase family 39U member 1 n=1 Tax=Varanus komodoensis TaxID=61221 RepID=A0A8D2ILS6_VARKO|nr:epimerase family protein SDR39U1 [Varanus komodoensis]XP_044278352.1 epimerase family protein SDR39U1 [Varanus komodoensis]
MRVLVGGGTGFIGRALTQLLRSHGHEVTPVSRRPGKNQITWDELSRLGLPPCEGAVNLAGENVLNPLRRWNESFRQEVVASRVETTKVLAKAIAEAEHPPRTWVLVTGVGYYPPSHSAEYTEESPGGDFDFFSRLVSHWEAAAKIPGDATRQVVVRSGVVLGRDGGAIAQMLWPFRCGLGGPIASGCQPFPWIHVADLAGIVAHVLEQEGVGGILNGVAPSAVNTTNGDFARAMGSVLRRPAVLPLPGFVVSAIFGAERSVMLLEGQRVVPKRTLQSNYQFAFPDLHSALQDILASP